MPTFTAIALERLLEPGSRDPAQKPPPIPITVERAARDTTVRKSVPWPYISPALYATPVATPLPDSPSSIVSESPYLINHKRRGPRLINGFQKSDASNGQSQQSDVELKVDVVQTSDHGIKSREADNAHTSNGETLTDEASDGKVQNQNMDIGKVGAEDVKKPLSHTIERDDGNDDSFDIHSIASNFKIGDISSQTGSSTSMGEFYDALEEFSSGGTPQSSYNNSEDELCDMKLNLLLEIQKRAQAEESLEQLRNLWQKLSHQLSLLGLSLPIPPNNSEDINAQLNLEPVEELPQQIVVARFVADAISRGCARAEVELEMEPQIAAKNFEISRLGDRLQYYEVANREISQRNQQAVEMARQQRNKRKKRQKWVWGSVCLAISLSATAITWSYLSPSNLIADECDASTGSEQEY
ncbi:uncharacterized protein LOC122025562 isoform X1 [Zingiber officinale]|uniref:Uncharacterized protein n=1 Tax=Zingiber officinale TaxID=94328 RepID=A0A8J5KDG4_ZINOF|nr:uncharacterized protein LOC122025562 isoform X1 [Zingiber officinale]KAG6476643.1 hypothetical protein ZIOFF_065888 [Zingiber officinale]